MDNAMNNNAKLWLQIEIYHAEVQFGEWNED